MSDRSPPDIKLSNTSGHQSLQGLSANNYKTDCSTRGSPGSGKSREGGVGPGVGTGGPAMKSNPQSDIRRASLSPSPPTTSPLHSRPLTIVCDNNDNNVASSTSSRLSGGSGGISDARDSGVSQLSGRGSRASPHRLSSESSNGGGSGSDEPTPTSPTRQLNKLKRFLATLQSLGSDISPDIGDRVHTLVISLVNSTMSIEEFHDQLHKTTNFPLRPFVVPFLKSSLPILQEELKDQAQRARMSPSQFLAKNEFILFDVLPSPSSESPGYREARPPKPLNDNGKRSYPVESGMNGNHHISELPRLPKYSRQHSPGSEPIDVTSSVSRDSVTSYGYGIRPIRLQDISTSRMLREQMERERLLQERDRYFNVYNLHRSEMNSERLERRDEDLKELENILQCVSGLLEKCQRSISVLQQRNIRASREEPSRRRSEESNGLPGGLPGGLSGLGGDLKRGQNPPLTSRHNDDHRLDMIRKAEEAVKEVKRQAVSELQKAVVAAEAKANEILAVDRLKMERALEEVKQRTRDEVTTLLTRQEDSKESCWNCGRLASETCSGCNEARYCGSFCQHRHWETHHRVCGRPNASITSSSSSCRTAMTSDESGSLNHRSLANHSTEHNNNITSSGSVTPGGGVCLGEILIKQEKL